LVNTAPGNIKVPQAALLHALKEAGWNDMGRIASREFTTQKHIYTAPNDETINALSKTELRKKVEPELNRKLTLVN
jgi:hypothetical protein